MGKTFWGVASAAVEQSMRKANMAALWVGKFGPWDWPQDPSKPKKTKQLQLDELSQDAFFPECKCNQLVNIW